MPKSFSTRKSDNTSKYRCCCNCMHVKTGTKVVAYFQLTLAVLGLIDFLFTTQVDTVLATLEILSIICESIGLIILCAGIQKESPKFLLPYIVFDVFTVIISLAMVSLGAFKYGDPIKYLGNFYTEAINKFFGPNAADVTDVRVIVGITAFLVFILAAIFIWYINVVFKYYLYLKNKNEQARVQNDIPMQYVQYRLKKYPAA